MGELSIDPPTLSPGELDASPITLEIGSPRSPIEKDRGTGELNVAMDEETRVAEPDATENEEIRIGESIRIANE